MEEPNDSPNFQTMNIIYKMKKIKKNRKNNKNVQNITQLEVLDNLPKDIPTDNVIEGLQGINDDDWDGLDEVVSQGEKTQGLITQTLADWINKAYIILITLNCLIALTITNSADKGSETISWKYMKDNDMVYVDSNNARIGQILNNAPISVGISNVSQEIVDDANQLYQYLCYFEALICAYFFTFIWYYIMFYSFIESRPQTTAFDFITREKLRENNTPLAMLFLFIFEYALVILEDVKWFLNECLPYYASKILSKPMSYIFLFLIIFHFNNNYLSYFKGLLIDILNSNYVNPFINILYFIVIAEYIASYNLYSKIKGAASDDPMAKASVFMDAYVNYLTFNYVTAFLSFLKEVLRIIIIMMVAVPTGALLCIMYFLWVSIFSNFSKLFDGSSFNNVVRFINSDIGKEGTTDPCNIPTTFWEKFKDGVKNWFLYLSMAAYNNLIYFIVIFYCIHVLTSHLGNINGDGAQMMIQILHIIILALTVLFFFIHIKSFGKTGVTDIFHTLVSPPADELAKSLLKTSEVIAGIISVVVLIITMTIIGVTVVDSS